MSFLSNVNLSCVQFQSSSANCHRPNFLVLALFAGQCLWQEGISAVQCNCEYNAGTCRATSTLNTLTFLGQNGLLAVALLSYSSLNSALTFLDLRRWFFYTWIVLILVYFCIVLIYTFSVHGLWPGVVFIALPTLPLCVLVDVLFYVGQRLCFASKSPVISSESGSASSVSATSATASLRHRTDHASVSSSG